MIRRPLTRDSVSSGSWPIRPGLGQLVLARPDLIRSLVATIGLDRTEEMLHRYLRARPPQRWTAREGEQFASWLAEDVHV
jgi:hypothetical protein